MNYYPHLGICPTSASLALREPALRISFSCHMLAIENRRKNVEINFIAAGVAGMCFSLLKTVRKLLAKSFYAHVHCFYYVGALETKQKKEVCVYAFYYYLCRACQRIARFIQIYRIARRVHYFNSYSSHGLRLKQSKRHRNANNDQRDSRVCECDGLTLAHYRMWTHWMDNGSDALIRFLWNGCLVDRLIWNSISQKMSSAVRFLEIRINRSRSNSTMITYRMAGRMQWQWNLNADSICCRSGVTFIRDARAVMQNKNSAKLNYWIKNV